MVFFLNEQGQCTKGQKAKGKRQGAKGKRQRGKRQGQFGAGRSFRRQNYLLLAGHCDTVFNSFFKAMKIKTLSKNILSGSFAALLVSVFFTAFGCKTETTCKYKPTPIFEAGLPHVTQYDFQKQGSKSLESLLLDTGVLLEIDQDICNESRQEYRFNVKGNYTSFPDSLWLREASRQLVFLSTFSPKQAALKTWADVIEQRRGEMRLGEDREMEPGIFVRVDRVVGPDESTLVLVFLQK